MSTELVTSPENGVLISTASHYLLLGHRLCLTVDVIKEDSAAERNLFESMDRERFRGDLLSHSRRIQISKSVASKAKDIQDKINAAAGDSWLTLPLELKKVVRGHLRSLSDLLWVSGRTDSTEDSD